MAQSITLKIAGKEYPLVVNSEEKESFYRTAAEEINAMISKYDEMYPDKSVEDKLVFEALNETVSKLSLEERTRRAAEELGKLGKELSDYLEGIEKNR